ncbi:MAG: glycosyltransferase [Pseudomonadota bacterium]
MPSPTQTAQAAPHIMPGTAPNITNSGPHIAPNTGSNTAPSTVSSTAPGPVPETAAPDATPDATPDRPLVTFYVMGYRTGPLLREGIASAFAQTYAPLEIILSDDCSPDDTFEIMQEMAAAYDGPHRIKLNRNPENLGQAAHINRIMELAEGEFIVQHNADDISLPERTERLVEAWLASGRRIKSFHTAMERIDAEGRHLRFEQSKQALIDDPSPRNMIENNLYAVGASAAWSREIWEQFGPLRPYAINEDSVIPFRAMLLGELGYIPEVLMRWRVGGVSWSGATDEWQGRGILYGRRMRNLRVAHAARRSFLDDMALVGEFPGKAECIALCEAQIRRMAPQIGFAAMSRGARLAALPGSLRRSLAERDAFYLRCNLKYLFDGLVIRYLDLRDRLAGKSSKAAPRSASQRPTIQRAAAEPGRGPLSRPGRPGRPGDQNAEA